MQDWLTTPLEKLDRSKRSGAPILLVGPAGSLGDIGTHAYNLACFVTGLSCEHVAADVTTFVSGRRLDDNVHVMLRFSKGAKGGLWATQVAPGNENNLSLRVYGEKAGLEWRQENPNLLSFTPLGQTRRTITRGGPGTGRAAAHATRIPSGHPEGYLEAFAQLYTDLAEQISAKIEKRTPNPDSLLVPSVGDGVEGVKFINAVLESSRNRSACPRSAASFLAVLQLFASGWRRPSKPVCWEIGPLAMWHAIAAWFPNTAPSTTCFRDLTALKNICRCGRMSSQSCPR